MSDNPKPKMRRVRITLTMELRDMTPDEFNDANEGGSDDHDGPDGWVDQLGEHELDEPIEGALGSENNPEMFAGSGLFIVTENASVEKLEWLTP